MLVLAEIPIRVVGNVVAFQILHIFHKLQRLCMSVRGPGVFLYVAWERSKFFDLDLCSTHTLLTFHTHAHASSLAIYVAELYVRPLHPSRNDIATTGDTTNLLL